MQYFHLICFLCLVWRSTRASAESIHQLQNNVHSIKNQREPVSDPTSHASVQVQEKPVPRSTGTSIKLPALRTTRLKRTPTGFTARGIHEDIFDRDFGHFSPVKRMQKRRPEADTNGFYGDTFSNGFGEFETMKRNFLPYYLRLEDAVAKRRPEMTKSGFDGDMFNSGFGEFHPMKKSLVHLQNTVKRRPEMSKSGFHDDVFNSGFGEFSTM